VGDIIYINRVNRAASRSAMDKLETFYVDGIGQTMSSHTGNSSSTSETKCFTWTGATVDVCYTWRPDSDTKGDWKVGDFEDMLNTVHGNLLKGQPLCAVDKWFDNHYAVDSMTTDGSTFVDYVNNNKDAIYYCSSKMGPGASGYSLHYLFDPCGWGIQLNVNMNDAGTPSGCSSAAAAAGAPAFVQGTNNPACSPGTCTSTPPPSPSPPSPGPSPTPPTGKGGDDKSWLASNWWIIAVAAAAVVIVVGAGLFCYCRTDSSGDLSDQMAQGQPYETLEDGRGGVKAQQGRGGRS